MKSTAGTPGWQGEVLQLGLLVPGFLAPLVGLVVWGPLDAQELSCLVALHSFAWTRAIREGPQGVVNARGRITHTFHPAVGHHILAKHSPVPGRMSMPGCRKGSCRELSRERVFE